MTRIEKTYKFIQVHPWILERKDHLNNWNAVMSYYRYHEIQFELISYFLKEKNNNIQNMNDLLNEISIKRVSDIIQKKPEDITEYTKNSFEIIKEYYRNPELDIKCLTGQIILNEKDKNSLIEHILEKTKLFLNHDNLKYPLPQMRNHTGWKLSYHKEYPNTNHQKFDREIIRKNILDWKTNPDSWRLLFFC